MNHQLVGFALIVVFTLIGILSYPYVRRSCAARDAAD